MTGTRTSGIRKRKRAKGTVYEVRYRDPEGALRGRSFPSEAAAKAFLTDTRKTLQDRTYLAPEHGRQTWGKVADDWLAGKQRRGLKVLTLDGYRRILGGWLAEWSKRQVGSLTHEDVEAVLAALHDAGRSTQTQHNVFNVAQSVFDYAQKRRLINTNPCRLVREELPSRAQSPYSPRFLSAGEVQRLAAELPAPYDLMVTFAAWSGLRAGEVAGLRVRNVDPLRATVRVEETIVTAAGGQRTDTPKSKASRRTVPIPRTLARLLADHVAASGLAPDDYLFGRDGKPLRHNNFYRRVYAPAVARAGLGHLRFHDLRHTYASLMAAQGHKAHEVSRWMGHGSISVTMDVYTHLFPDDEGLADRLDAAFNDVQPQSRTVVPFPTAAAARPRALAPLRGPPNRPCPPDRGGSSLCGPYSRPRRVSWGPAQALTTRCSGGVEAQRLASATRVPTEQRSAVMLTDDLTTFMLDSLRWIGRLAVVDGETT